MRPSKKTEILTAAVRVAARLGARGVTLEAVAAEAGVTRGGLAYHFKDRDDLAAAIQQHLADSWEAMLLAEAGAPVEMLTSRQRLMAYMQVAMSASQPGEYQLILQGAGESVSNQPWVDVIERWTRVDEGELDSPRALAHLVTRLIADGAWAYDLLGGNQLDAKTKSALLTFVREQLL